MSRKTYKKKKRKSGGVYGKAPKIRQTNSSTNPYSKVTHKKKSVISGNNLRAALVKFCDNSNQYDKLTQKIKENKEYIKAFIQHLDEKIDTFSYKTLKCIEPFLEKLKDSAQDVSDIDKIKSHYDFIINIDTIIKNGDRDNLVGKFKEACDSKNEKEYDKITLEIKNKYINENNKDFFTYLKYKLKLLDKETLKCLERSLTGLQEDAIPESMPHLHYILTHRNS